MDDIRKYINILNEATRNYPSPKMNASTLFTHIRRVYAKYGVELGGSKWIGVPRFRGSYRSNDYRFVTDCSGIKSSSIVGISEEINKRNALNLVVPKLYALDTQLKKDINEVISTTLLKDYTVKQINYLRGTNLNLFEVEVIFNFPGVSGTTEPKKQEIDSYTFEYLIQQKLPMVIQGLTGPVDGRSTMMLSGKNGELHGSLYFNVSIPVVHNRIQKILDHYRSEYNILSTEYPKNENETKLRTQMSTEINDSIRTIYSVYDRKLRTEGLTNLFDLVNQELSKRGYTLSKFSYFLDGASVSNFDRNYIFDKKIGRFIPKDLVLQFNYVLKKIN